MSGNKDKDFVSPLSFCDCTGMTLCLLIWIHGIEALISHSSNPKTTSWTPQALLGPRLLPYLVSSPPN